MRLSKALVLCSVGFASISLPAYAQEADDGVNSAGSTGDIIVTARRRDESLQDVPQTVNAVTSAVIEKLNLQGFKDIQAVVPGLTLSGGYTGSDAGFSLRGVSFNTLAQTAGPTVQFYMNEAPVDSNLIFQSMYDVGQIEVLRGPQGTLRGKSAPSGAITLTTRKPNLDEWGGYASLTGTTRGNINANAAVNVPLIDGVLAVRVAGSIDHNDLDGIRSVNNPVSPFSRTESGRISVLFQPTDNIRASVMYQYMNVRNRSFQPVVGFADPFSATVIPGILVVNLPAGGPAIAAGQRLGVVEGARTGAQEFHLVTGSIDWSFAGQKLTYVGSYAKQVASTQTPQDTYNIFPGFESYQDITPAGQRVHSHELRLASEERLGGIFDYTIGAFLQRANGFAGGISGQPNPYTPVTTYISNNAYTAETSFFASGTLHLGDRTELTAGARHIHYTYRQPGPYGVLGQGNSICITGAANFCLANTAVTTPIVENAWVWNASLSHRFSDSLLAYATVGTSYRPGFQVLVPSALDGTNPASGNAFISSNDLRSKPAEKSTGVELGVKSNFWDNRIRLNVAGYYQKFKNNSFYISNIPYYDVTNATLSLGSFTATADAVVWGVDVDASFQITPNWSLTAGFAWANGHVDNDDIPCRDANFDGIADNGTPTITGFTDANVIVARCRSNQSISTSPKWSLTLQSEYSHSINDRFDGFIRGLFTYYPDNPNNNQNIVIGDYGLLNLYAGIRAPNNAWEISLFAKNLTNTQQVVSYGDIPPSTSLNFGAFGSVSVPVNYRTVGYTPRREFGLNVRYAFGSR